MRTSIHQAALGFALAAVACNGRVVDLDGNTPDGGTSSVASGSLSSAKLCTIPAPTDAGALSVPEDARAIDTIVGTWTGYVEGYTFLSGSDAVVVAFTAAADGTIAGTVTFGNAPAPAPPTSGNEPYPTADVGDLNTAAPYEGFPYTAIQVSFDGTRLRLGTVHKELWKTWCSLQTSYDWAPSAAGNCGCLPDWPSMGSTDPNASDCVLTDPDTGADVPVSCALTAPCLIYPVCYCTAGSCTVDMTHADTTIDVRLASGQFSGSVVGLPLSPLNVYLMQSP
jgi:hypothetical protein